MSDMADVLARHYPQYRRKNGIEDYGWECTDRSCPFGWTRDFSDAMAHQAAALSAAGFGPVRTDHQRLLLAATLAYDAIEDSALQQARAEGWDRGHHDGAVDAMLHMENDGAKTTSNPYREDT